MHIEIQVALNFVISYLYNKLPRRRVNLFGEELEKALKLKFVGHWYPEKPFKGSAFRCLKTGDPIDAVLDRAARESGVPISDILENLPAELSVWIDPKEVSYRIGEKGPVKILYSEQNDLHEEYNADREVTKTFNPEAQCFRPIEIVSNGMNNLSLNSNAQHDATSNGSSPMYGKNGAVETSPAPATSFLHRSQEQVVFTTATFAQTKFGSTKLKNNSKRTNRMSPTEFSNYLKQRSMQQQPIGQNPMSQQQQQPPNHFGPIGSISPSRSISPSTFASQLQNDPKFFLSNLNSMNMYPFGGSPRNNAFDNSAAPNNFQDPFFMPLGGGGGGGNKMQQQQHPQANNLNASALSPIGQGSVQQQNQQQQHARDANTSNNAGGGNNNGMSNDKLIDGLNAYYSSNPGSYHHLLVAN
ncbi:protein Tob1 [Culicoides brevitarsis]|uniref:protein Tob1 n=1 Tax=Culicoides brevitarsis TaxID=469753 RepID=UPI00307B7355